MIVAPIPTLRKLLTKGESGRRYSSAKFHIPRQNKIIPIPVNNSLTGSCMCKFNNFKLISTYL